MTFIDQHRHRVDFVYDEILSFSFVAWLDEIVCGANWNELDLILEID